MSKLLDQAVAQARTLSEDEQDEAAEMLLALISKRDEPIELDEETTAAIQEGLDQARRGEFVSDEEMAAFFKRHGM